LPRIGIDLGGTKIEGIVLGDDGVFGHRRRVETPSGDYAGTLSAIVDLVLGLEGAAGRPCTVGIGTPGAASPTSGLMRNANSVCLNDRPLADDLARSLQRDIRIANDADCFALSEAVDGAAAGAYSVFGVILGTGTGGGIVIDGRLHTGPNAVAGEWGHNPLPWPADDERPGPDCYCGRQGCIETWLSGPGLARDFDATGATAPADIVTLAERGDRAAEQCIERYEDRLARSLAGVINVLDPEAVVLGGGLSQMARLYTGVPKRLRDYVFSDTLLTRLLPPLHGDSSGVRGAARLWPA